MVSRLLVGCFMIDIMANRQWLDVDGAVRCSKPKPHGMPAFEVPSSIDPQHA
jgi:hypothetical protein